MSATQVLNPPTYYRPLWLQMTLYKKVSKKESKCIVFLRQNNGSHSQ